jgi:hypothetical protein
LVAAGLLGCVLVAGGLTGCGPTGDTPTGGGALTAGSALTAGAVGPTAAPTAGTDGSAAAVRVDVSAAPGVEAALVERVRTDVGDAVRHVRTVWDGPWSSDVDVYVVPDGTAVADAADGLRVGAEQLDGVAAVAVVPTAALPRGPSPPSDEVLPSNQVPPSHEESSEPGPGEPSEPPRGRLVVNADIYRQLSDVGRVVVTRHEVTHLASASATPPDLPVWLVEGFADAVARTGLSGDARAAAPELTSEVTAGRVPSELPADEAFAGTGGRLAQTYQQAWLACQLVVDRVGIVGLVRLYREAGTGPTSDSASSASVSGQGAGAAARLEAALVDVLGLDQAAFTATWRAYLVRTLSASR